MKSLGLKSVISERIDIGRDNLLMLRDAGLTDNPTLAPVRDGDYWGMAIADGNFDEIVEKYDFDEVDKQDTVSVSLLHHEILLSEVAILGRKDWSPGDCYFSLDEDIPCVLFKQQADFEWYLDEDQSPGHPVFERHLLRTPSI